MVKMWKIASFCWNGSWISIILVINQNEGEKGMLLKCLLKTMISQPNHTEFSNWFALPFDLVKFKPKIWESMTLIKKSDSHKMLQYPSRKRIRRTVEKKDEMNNEEKIF